MSRTSKKKNQKKFGLTTSFFSKDLHENGPDSAHLNVVHTDAAFFPSIIKHHWSASWDKSSNEQKHISKIQVNESASILGLLSIPFSNITAHINQIGPGLVHFNFT